MILKAISRIILKKSHLITGSPRTISSEILLKILAKNECFRRTLFFQSNPPYKKNLESTPLEH